MCRWQTSKLAPDCPAYCAVYIPAAPAPFQGFQSSHERKVCVLYELQASIHTHSILLHYRYSLRRTVVNKSFDTRHLAVTWANLLSLKNITKTTTLICSYSSENLYVCVCVSFLLSAVPPFSLRSNLLSPLFLPFSCGPNSLWSRTVLYLYQSVNLLNQ